MTAAVLPVRGSWLWPSQGVCVHQSGRHGGAGLSGGGGGANGEGGGSGGGGEGGAAGGGGGCAGSSLGAGQVPSAGATHVAAPPRSWSAAGARVSLPSGSSGSQTQLRPARRSPPRAPR